MSLTPVTYLLLLVANVAPTFDKRYKESEELINKSAVTPDDEKRARELLKAILADAVIEDERLYARRRLAWWEFRRGDRDKARKMLEEALRGAPEDSYLTFQITDDLAEFSIEAVRQEAAEKYVDQALKLAEHELLWMKGKKYAVPPGVKTRLRIRKAELTVFRTGDLPAAQKTFSDLRAEIGDKPADAGWAVLAAKCDLNLVDLERRLGHPYDALGRLKKCAASLRPFDTYEAAEIRFGCHINLATIYYPLTRFKDARDETDAAAKLLPRIDNARNAADLDNVRAVVVLEECGFRFANDPDDPVLADLLKEAEKHARAALGRYEPAANNSIAHTTLALGQVRALRARVLEAGGAPQDKVRAQYRQAQESTAEALRRFRKTLPEENDLVLQCRRLLAGTSLKLGQVAAAREEAEDAFALFRKVHPREDEDLMGRGLFLQQLLEVEAQAGNLAAAARYARDHRRLSAERLVAFLAGLTAPEQIKFFRTWDDPGLHGSLRLGLRSADLAADSAEWLINGKARSAEVLAEVIRRQRRDKDYPQLQQAIARQAYFLYAASSEDPSRRTRLLEVEAVKREFAARQPIRPSQTWYTLPKLRERLADDEVYIDVFCLRPEEGAPRAYYAWVVKAKGPVEVVRLGGADKIEPLVEALGKHMKDCLNEGFLDDAAKVECGLCNTCLGPLSGLILKDLLPLVKDKKRWVVSPDGPLWNVPWGALVLPDGGAYLIEKHTVRYLISGRDLARPAAAGAAAGDPWVVANPDYDWKPPGLTGRHQLRARDLPGAEAEGRAVAARLKPFFKAEPKALTRKAATKAAFLELARLARSPRVVYLTTHGFSSLTEGFGLPATRPGDDVPQVDPLLGCGLAFAGVNFIPDGKSAEAQVYPGLLTGAEVLAVDLHGTELVVLSACQTGTGKRGTTSFGQSPADLRHAFHLAGARDVVSSLWSVDDEATRELMVSFMESYARRPAADQAEALAQAQRDMIGKRRKSDHDAHPFFWAGFTLSGP